MQPPSRLAVLLPAILLAAACGPAPAKPAAGGPPPVPVVTAPAVRRDLPLVVRAIGHLEASAEVVVRPQVTGILAAAPFREGDEVAAGQLLFTIDQKPFSEDLRRTEAQLARSRAAVRQAQAALARDRAQLANAENEARRSAGLHAQGFVAGESNDQVQTAAQVQRATVAASEAAAETASAAVVADEATAAVARLQLGYCEIRAPFAGRIGRRAVDPGALVTAGQTALATLVAVRPLHVTCSVPDDQLAALHRGQAAAPLPVEVTAAGGTRAQGQVDLIEPQVDAVTGTVRLRAVIPNAEGALWPGQQVEIGIQLALERQVLAVPVAAVLAGQRGSFAWVAKPDGAVEARPVTVARSEGGLAVVAKGLADDEQVVIEGQHRLAPNGRWTAPAASATRAAPAATAPAMAGTRAAAR